MITQPGPVFDPPPEPVPFTPDPSAVLPATAEVVVVVRPASLYRSRYALTWLEPFQGTTPLPR